jgi:hypothetical protein
MLEEITKAVEFLYCFVRNHVTESQGITFKSVLAKELEAKIQLRTWSHQYPDLGSAYRAISVTGGILDPLLAKAANVSRISLDNLSAHLPKEFILWVDPGSVSYRIGEYGSIAICHESKSYVPNTYVACAELMNQIQNHREMFMAR